MRQKDDYSCAPVAIINWMRSSGLSRSSAKLMEDVSLLLQTDRYGTMQCTYMALIKVITSMRGGQVYTNNQIPKDDLPWSNGAFFEFDDSAGDPHLAFGQFERYDKLWGGRWIVENSQIWVKGKMKNSFTREELNELLADADGQVHEVIV